MARPQRGALGVNGDDLFDQSAARRSHQPQFVPVMNERSGEDARLLQQIAVEPQRCNHVARVVRRLGESLSVTAQGSEGLDDRLNAFAVGGLQRIVYAAGLDIR
jgi:hypothetical protein